MASIQKIDYESWTTLTAEALTSASGEITFSGADSDSDIVIVLDNGSVAGTDIVIKAGDYQNSDSLTVTDVEANTVKVITGLDGTKYRQDDGSYELSASVDAAGTANLYVFQKEID